MSNPNFEDPSAEDAPESATLDPRVIIAFFQRRLITVAATTVIVVAFVLIVVLQMTPRYEATSTVLLDVQPSQVVDIEAVMTGIGAGVANANAQTAILTSRAIAVRVVERLGLSADPEFYRGRRSVLAALNPLNWFGDEAALDLQEDGTINGRTVAELRTEMAIQAVRDRMKVKASSITQTIDISFESEDPERAAEIANAIADEYALDQLEAKFEETKNAAEWLSRRLEGMRSALDASERAVEYFRAENNLIDADGLLLSEQELSELNSQLILIRAEKAEKQAAYSRAQQLLSGGASLESVSEVLQSSVISALRQQQAELTRRQADLTSRYGPRHPQMINVQAERRDLESQIQQEITRIVGSLKNAVAVVSSKERSIEQSLAERRVFASENNQALVQLRALERDAEATRTLYETFLTRFKEVNEQETLQSSGVRVISPAITPGGPSFPRVSLFLAGALVVGLMMGCGVAVAQELLDDSFHTAKQIEQVLGLPNIGVVPFLESGKNLQVTPDYVLEKPLSPYSEAFRGLRTSLELSNVDNPPKVILFTSAIPAEGKSTLATSFALAAAHAGQKVVIVDCDLRKPRVHKLLASGPIDSGLVEYLANPTTVSDLVRRHERSGADFIPVAKGSINPTEILGSRHMADLVAALREQYDLVVIDSAPLLPVSDTRVVASLADTTVLAVRWGQTPRAASLNAVNLLRRSGQRIAGTVLSAVDMNRQSAYGYGDSAYTYGNYGDYYSG